MKHKRTIVLVVFISLLVRLIFFFSYHEIWWDSSVYIGMGKFIFSWGKLGLWEHIRPILWPTVLGLIWKLGLDVVVAGRVLTLILSLGIIALTYKIANLLFNRATAVIASLIVSFSSVLFHHGFHLYADIPAVFLVLLGIYLYIKQRYFWSAFLIGLAFLTKFTTGIFFIIVALLSLKPLKKLLSVSTGFILAVLPYLITNYIMYGSLIKPLVDAKIDINRVLICNYINLYPSYQYLIWIVRENPFHLISIFALYYALKNLNRKKALIILAVVLPLSYFTIMRCKHYRYLIIVIPFIAILTAYSITTIVKKKMLKQLGLVVIVLSMVSCISYYLSNEVKYQNEAIHSYHHFLENKPIHGEVWTTDPAVNLYVNRRVNKIYYRFYNAELAKKFLKYLKNNNNIDYVFVDNCGGGMICPPYDNACSSETKKILSYLESNYDKVFNRQLGRCFYRIFKSRYIKS